MTRWRHIIVITLASLLLALLSVGSVMQMVPDRSELAFSRVVLLGIPADDICGDQGHDHSCPFCRLTPDTPDIRPTQIAFVLRPADCWRQLSTRHRAAQARRHAQTPRAPPSSIV